MPVSRGGRLANRGEGLRTTGLPPPGEVSGGDCELDNHSWFEVLFQVGRGRLRAVLSHFPRHFCADLCRWSLPGFFCRLVLLGQGESARRQEILQHGGHHLRITRLLFPDHANLALPALEVGLEQWRPGKGNVEGNGLLRSVGAFDFQQVLARGPEGEGGDVGVPVGKQLHEPAVGIGGIEPDSLPGPREPDLANLLAAGQSGDADGTVGFAVGLPGLFADSIEFSSQVGGRGACFLGVGGGLSQGEGDRLHLIALDGNHSRGRRLGQGLVALFRLVDFPACQVDKRRRTPHVPRALGRWIIAGQEGDRRGGGTIEGVGEEGPERGGSGPEDRRLVHDEISEVALASEAGIPLDGQIGEEDSLVGLLVEADVPLLLRAIGTGAGVDVEGADFLAEQVGLAIVGGRHVDEAAHGEDANLVFRFAEHGEDQVHSALAGFRLVGAGIIDGLEGVFESGDAAERAAGEVLHLLEGNQAWLLAVLLVTPLLADVGHVDDDALHVEFRQGVEGCQVVVVVRIVVGVVEIGRVDDGNGGGCRIGHGENNEQGRKQAGHGSSSSAGRSDRACCGL